MGQLTPEQEAALQAAERRLAQQQALDAAERRQTGGVRTAGERVNEAGEMVFREISDVLGLTTRGEPAETGTAEGVVENLQNLGTDALGGPVDLANTMVSDPLGLQGTMTTLFGTPPPEDVSVEEPIGGSAFLRDMFGVTDTPEESILGSLARGGGEGLLFGLGFGGSAASRAGAVLRGAPRPTSALGGVLNEMGRTTLERPIRALTAEAAAGGAALAAGEWARAEFPDSPAAQVLAELIGGVAAPVAIAGSVTAPVRGVDWLIQKAPGLGVIRRVISPPGETRAQARFSRAVGDGGDEVLARLNDEVLPGLSYAQRSESPGLLSLEVSLANRSDVGRAERAAGLNEVRESIRNEMLGVAGEVDYEAARTYLSDLLDTNLQVAARAANEAVTSLGVTAGRQEINEAVANEMRQILVAARETEGQLYNAVPMEVQSATTEARTAYETILAQTPRAQQGDIPEIATRFLGQEGRQNFGDAEPVSEMQGLRSELLQVARNSRAGDNPNFNRARIADLLADAVLADMSATEGGEALRTALTFSRELNQRFRQGPVGRLLGYARAGDRAVAPGLFLESSVGRGGPRGAVEQQAILDAADRSGAFTDVAGQSQEVMRSNIDDYLRVRFHEMAVNSDGTLREAGVNQFFSADRGFGMVLERSPELRAQFDQIVRVGRMDAQARRSAGARTLAPNASAAAVFVNRPLNVAFNQVASHADPVAQMNSLVEMVGRDSTGRALAGLKTGFAEWMMSGGRQTGGDGWSLPSSDTLMRITGAEHAANDAQRRARAMAEALFTEDEMARLRVVANTLRKVELAEAAGPSVEGVIGDLPHRLRELLVANLALRGAAATGPSGPGQLSFAQRVSRSAVDMVNRIFADKAPEILAEGITNGRFFREVLDAPIDTIPQQERVRQRLNAWLASVAAEEGRELTPDYEGFLID